MTLYLQFNNLVSVECRRTNGLAMVCLVQLNYVLIADNGTVQRIMNIYCYI
jgi:hypothetical protein